MSDYLDRRGLRYRFYEYQEPDAASSNQTIERMYCCPCCEYPTICEPAQYEICPLCTWEDDGCDGYGPNACSLEEARENFRNFLTSYSADHECAPDPSGGRHFSHERELRPDVLASKRALMALLDSFAAEPDLSERGRILALAFPTAPPEEPSPVYNPEPGAIKVFADAEGWTKCPTCNFRFNVRSNGSIAESRHLRCGQLLDVVFR